MSLLLAPLIPHLHLLLHWLLKGLGAALVPLTTAGCSRGSRWRHGPCPADWEGRGEGQKLKAPITLLRLQDRGCSTSPHTPALSVYTLAIHGAGQKPANGRTCEGVPEGAPTQPWPSPRTPGRRMSRAWLQRPGQAVSLHSTLLSPREITPSPWSSAHPCA